MKRCDFLNKAVVATAASPVLATGPKKGKMKSSKH
jgi:hypothetical protein